MFNLSLECKQIIFILNSHLVYQPFPQKKVKDYNKKCNQLYCLIIVNINVLTDATH